MPTQEQSAVQEVKEDGERDGEQWAEMAGEVGRREREISGLEVR